MNKNEVILLIIDEYHSKYDAYDENNLESLIEIFYHKRKDCLLLMEDKITVWKETSKKLRMFFDFH